MVLTATDQLPEVIETLLANLDLCRIVILGGDVAISQAVQTKLQTLLG